MDHLKDAAWRTSSYSGSNGGNCIEVAVTSRAAAVRAVAVRDSKDPGGPRLAFTAATWAAFTGQLKTSR